MPDSTQPGTNAPLVSVIVLNFNGMRWLDNCFNTLREQDYPNFEVIMADNDSQDESLAYMAEHFPEVILHPTGGNLGYAAGNNHAAAAAQGEFLFFLNNDTKTDPACLSRLVERMVAEPDLGILGCKELTYDEGKLISVGVGADFFGYPTDSERVFYADGAAVFIRRELFEQLGGFDDQSFMFFEDLDLSWRAWMLGYRVDAEPAAIIYHKVGGSSENEYGETQYLTSSFRRKLSERNNLRNLLKNYRCVTLAWVLPIYLAINLAELVFFGIKGGPRLAAQIYLGSWLANLKDLPETLRRRRRIQTMRVQPDRRILAKMLPTLGKLVALKNVGKVVIKG